MTFDLNRFLAHYAQIVGYLLCSYLGWHTADPSLQCAERMRGRKKKWESFAKSRHGIWIRLYIYTRRLFVIRQMMFGVLLFGLLRHNQGFGRIGIRDVQADSRSLTTGFVLSFATALIDYTFSRWIRRWLWFASLRGTFFFICFHRLDAIINCLLYNRPTGGKCDMCFICRSTMC